MRLQVTVVRREQLIGVRLYLNISILSMRLYLEVVIVRRD